MSVAFKLASLGVRTLAKPIGNYLKHQAREHEGFRKVCVSFAQRLHRIDMRMRLGLLQDPAVIERQIKREQDEAERKKNPEMKPTVKTKEQAEVEDREKEDIRKKLKRGRPIKPLSEAKAIDSGATFISEGFLFLVAGGLILVEQWRGKRKDSARRDEVRDRLDALEGQLEGLRSENQNLKGSLSAVDGAVGPQVFDKSKTSTSPAGTASKEITDPGSAAQGGPHQRQSRTEPETKKSSQPPAARTDQTR